MRQCTCYERPPSECEWPEHRTKDGTRCFRCDRLLVRGVNTTPYHPRYCQPCFNR